MSETSDDTDRETVYVSDAPKRILGNLLIDGPDGQCSYMYAGISERCPSDAVAHTYMDHGGEDVRVEMCSEHAREDVPEPPSPEQKELITDGGTVERDSEHEVAEAAVNLYRSLDAITDGGSLSDDTVADLLEKYAEELR